MPKRTAHLDRLDALDASPYSVYIESETKGGKMEFSVNVRIVSFYACLSPKFVYNNRLILTVRGLHREGKEIFEDNFIVFYEFQLFKLKDTRSVRFLEFSEHVRIDNL